MRISWRSELPQLLVIAAMFASAAWSWSRVPEQIPGHWNIHGEIDSYDSKAVGLLLLPSITAGTYLLMLLVPLVDPGRSNYGNFAKAFNAIRIVLVLFLGVVYAVTLFAAFGLHADMNMVMFLALAALFLVIGNFMGKIRPNWFVGVRTPWTLSSKLSWDKTHRLAGWLFVLMSVLLAVTAFVETTWMFIATFTVVGLCIVWMIVYSYVVFRRDPDRSSPADTLPANESSPGLGQK